MLFKNKHSKILGLTFGILLSLIFLNGCSVPEFAKPKKVSKNVPVNAKERARQNVDTGKGVSLKNTFGGNRSTTYQFSTSNPLWRSSLEILDFLPLTTVDYSGGIIITDWYNDSQNLDESIKITVRFLSNEIRSDSVKIIVHSKKCSKQNNCSITQKKSKISLKKSDKILCARFREGHFEGVLDILDRFVKLISPKIIFMGEKDYQQFFLVKRYIEKKYKSKVYSSITIRNSNNVALSSRNNLLNHASLKTAGLITHQLFCLKRLISKNRNKSNNLINIFKKELIQKFNIRIEYLESRNLINLSTKLYKKRFRLFVAYYLNNVRLIDNF